MSVANGKKEKGKRILIRRRVYKKTAGPVNKWKTCVCENEVAHATCFRVYCRFPRKLRSAKGKGADDRSGCARRHDAKDRYSQCEINGQRAAASAESHFRNRASDDDVDRRGDVLC